MSIPDISYDDLRNLTIGTVESVSPSDIKILLDINAPQNTSINTGEPTLFPKINGYVLIPNEAGSLICIVSWIGVEHSAYPKRKGFKDFDLIDLPFPLRKMSVNPLGILKNQKGGKYKIDRGVYSYPSVGDNVVIPTRLQLESIVENRDKNANVKIGVSPLAANAPVYVDPDKLFGRHLAVLGNTGSGKSCSVAGLIRWSLESAKSQEERPNARFIILDPNGEYTNAMDGLTDNVRKFKVKLQESESSQELRVPAWLWNSHEWVSFTRAAPGIQRPLLVDALSLIKRGEATSANLETQLYNFLTGYMSFLKSILAIPPCNMQQRDCFRCRDAFDHFLIDIERYLDNFDEDLNSKLFDLKISVESFYHANSRTSQGQRYFNGCSETDLVELIEKFEEIDLLQTNITSTSNITADTPIQFPIESLSSTILTLASLQAGNLSQMADSLILRMKSLLGDARISDILLSGASEITLKNWLENYISNGDTSITIIDFSLVPNEINNLLVSVIARLIFEAIQRYQKKYNKVLPTALVIEEAHNFISKYKADSDDLSSATLCTRTFEKIAKEGRKFGLGLVLSSQRPSELSPTVLSQCNTFLLHRIVNDVDQQLVGKLVPDNLGKILNELPTLPTRKAILLGWASPVPILVEMNELEEKYRPKSDDPDFWDVWIKKEERNVNWSDIVADWQNNE